MAACTTRRRRSAPAGPPVAAGTMRVAPFLGEVVERPHRVEHHSPWPLERVDALVVVEDLRSSPGPIWMPVGADSW